MKRKSSKNNHSNGRIALAIFLAGISIFLLLAIVSYSPDDPLNLNVEDNPVITSNWMGPLGAVISSFLIQWTFGYAALVLPLIIALAGYAVFRKIALSSFNTFFIKSLLWAFLISIYLALPDALRTNGNIVEYFPSGLLGGWTAAKMVLYLGVFGTILIQLLFTFIMIVFTVDIPLNQFFSALANLWRNTITAISEKLNIIAEKIKKYKMAREELKQEKLSQKPPDISGIGDESQPDEKEITEQESADIEDEPLTNPLEINVEEKQDQLHFQETELSEEHVSRDDENLTTETDQNIESDEMDFEYQEAVQERQLDYDELVNESVAKYVFPSVDLLNSPPKSQQTVTREELKANAELLESKLLDFNVKAKVVRVTAGPVITLYELQPSPGVKVSSITSLENDLALAMEARGIRIIAPIPGVAAVGIEIPNRNRQTVYLKSLIRSEKFSKAKFELPIAVGKAINGESFIIDLVKMPHLLIAGATGSGKSVGINTIICSILYSVDPGRVKFVMVDPKKLELSIYRDIKEHYLIHRPDLDEDVITKPNNAVSILNSMVLEMERRQERMHQLGVRNMREYNAKVSANPKAYRGSDHQQMPYIIVIIEELADLMMISAKEIETPIARLAQMARAGGIHMVVATQRPSVDVITGLIKANLPARIAYQVPTKIDSRTILDINGAEQLLGDGDLLFKLTGTAKPVRLQGPFVATDEVEQIIKHIKKQSKLPYYSIPQPAEGRKAEGFSEFADEGRDPLYEDARAIVVQNQSGSISLLQRRLKIGYSRAARLVDEMEEEGVVGAAIGGKPREVLITPEQLSSLD